MTLKLIVVLAVTAWLTLGFITHRMGHLNQLVIRNQKYNLDEPVMNMLIICLVLGPIGLFLFMVCGGFKNYIQNRKKFNNG